MNRFQKIICKTLTSSLITLASSFALIEQAYPADQPNIMVVGEDADEDTVPRHSRIFNRVSDAIRNQMMAMGFQTFNETAVTMDMTNPGRIRRTDAELISVARSITATPIDVIIPFQIYASTNPDAYSDMKHLRIRIVGRMLQVQSGRDLGNFEVAVGPRGLRPLPTVCNPDCVLEHVGDEAKPIANEVGAILARKLDEISPTAPPTAINTASPIKQTVDAPKAAAPHAAPASPVSAETASTAGKDCSGLPSGYTIILSGFESEDVDAIEKILTAFYGYQHHRPLRSRTKYSEYWYETCSDRVRLDRNIRSLTDQLPGKNRYELSGGQIQIEHIPSVGKR
jgi:hypothetical protein